MRITTWITLMLAAFAPGLFAQIINWDGGGDGISWSDPLNWSGDAIPGATNVVAINIAAGATVISRSNVTVRSVQCTGGLTITNSDFTVTNGASFVNGTLTIANTRSLTALYSNTTFTANGPALIAGANLFATSGGDIEFTAVGTHADASVSFQSRTWQASGVGSVIRFPALTNVTGALSGSMQMRALTGGRIELPELATFQPGYVNVFVDGLAAAWDAPLLTNSPRNNSDFEARNGGVINLSSVMEWRDAALVIRATNSFIPTAQFTTLSNVSLTADRFSPNLSNVVAMPLSSLYAENGAKISLPNVHTYTNRVPTFESRELRATGAGSVVNLNNITNFANPSGAGLLYIRAFSGGQVLLAGVSALPSSRLGLWAEGVGTNAAPSLLDLPNLTNSPAGGTFIEARAGGTMNIPNLAAPTSLDLTLRGTNSTFPMAQFTTLSNSALTVDAVNLTLSNVTDAPLASLYVLGGGRLTMPNLRIYTNRVPTFESREFRATGAGSVLDLNSITNLANAPGAGLLYIRAFSGGQVLLGGIQILPASRLDIHSEGAGSLINLPNLVNSPGGSSSIESRSGGTLNVPNLIYATNLALVIRGTNSAFPLHQITSIANSALTVDAVNLTLSNIVDAALASLYVENGGRLALPNLTTYPTGIPTFESREFRATGAGSVLDLSALGTLMGGANGVLFVRSYGGGTVSLLGINTLPTARFNFYSEGATSLVALSNLVTSPRAGSEFEARVGGSLQIPLLTAAEDVSIILRSGGVMPTAQLTSISNSTVVVDAMTPNFNAVTNAGMSSLYAQNGGRLSLPGVTAYAAPLLAFSSRVWEANGAGSVLEITNLTEITHGTAAFAPLHVRSYFGGRARLDRLVRIQGSVVNLYSERADSRIEAPVLTNWTGGGNIEANLAGTVQFTTNSLTVSNVSVFVRTDSTILVNDLELSGSAQIYGNGVLMANVRNGGLVRPGASAGSLTFSNYIQLTNGSFQAELGGATPTNGYDVLQVIGTATLDGQLDVLRINNYAPAISSVHRIINASARVGEFSRFTGLNAGANTEFVPGYDATGAFLSATFSTGPVATNASPAGTVSGTLSFFDITFNEALNFGTMQTNDAIITGPSGIIHVTGLNLFSGRRARFAFPVQSTPGTYTIIVGPNIADNVGNSMNQDRDATNGEAIEDRYTNSVTLSSADLAVSNVTAPTMAAPGQRITVSYTIQNVGLDPAVGAHVDAVLLSTDALAGDDILIGLAAFSQTLATGAVVTVTQTVTIPIFGPAGNLRVVAHADYNNVIAETSEANNATLSATTLVVPHTLQLQVVSNVVTETGGAISALVSRNGDLTSPLLVNLVSDPTELTVPATVTIPAGLNSAPVPITPVHDNIADGPQIVGVVASAGGFVSASNSVTVLDVDTPRLTLSANTNALLEGGSLSVTVTREVVTGEALVVALSSTSPGQLSLPSTVTIVSNAASTNFTITAVEDTLIESSHGYSINASASNHISTNSVVTVHDNDVPALTWSVSGGGTVAEGGAVSATITRSFVGATALNIELVSSSPARLNAPSSVTIPVGQSSVAFTLSAVDNIAIDGNTAVTVTAYPLETQSGDRLAGMQTALVVNDNDGPALFVSISRDAVAEGQTVSATVTRNTPATNNLVISLLSDDASEATIPASVTISNGQTSAAFLVTSLDDGVSDGSVSVNITASTAGFTGGADSVLVTDVNLPDLVITSFTAPTNGLTGENFNITFREMNLGFANATGSWSQVVYLSEDPYPGDDEELTSFAFTGNVPPGLFVERSTQLRAPLTPGDYWIIVKSDASNTVTELIEDNNNAIAALPLRIDPSFTATVQTPIVTALANTPVAMTGTATRVGGGAAQFELVSIHILVKGTKRVIAAVTDSAGNFSATFTPLPGEGGSYTIGAAHPGVVTAPVQDAFTLLGMRFDPSVMNTQVVALTSVTGVVNLINLADVALAGLSASLIGVNPALNVSANVVGVLPPAGVLPVEFQITSLVDAPLTNVFTVRITSAEGATVDLRVTNKVVQLLPRLVAVPSSLEAGMRRGEQTIVPFTIMNLGGAESGPLTVQLPNEPFLHLSSPAVIDSIPAGASNTVTLQLLAATNQPLGVYYGSMVVSGTNSSVAVPYSFRSLSDSIGSLQIEVVDELTYYAVGSPRVSNATVIVRDSISGIIVTNGLTGSNGLFAASALPEGYYDLEVTADQHSTYRATILTPPGAATNITAFISRQVVRYVWTVVPTEIEDRTRISIETVFETFVPLPVITVEPALIDLADFTNEVTQIDLKIQNHGLIAAQNMGIGFGSHPDWSFTPLITEVGTLNAQSSITVPLTIRRLTPFDGSAKGEGRGERDGTALTSHLSLLRSKAGSCGVGGSVRWTLICGPGANGYSAGISIINAGGGGCGGGFGGGGNTGTPGGFGHPVTYGSPTDCNPCDGDISLAVAECLIGFTPLGLPYDLGKNGYECYQGISQSGWGGVGGCLQGFAVTAAEEALGLTPLGLPYDILKCIYEIIDAACGGTGGAPDGRKATATAALAPSYNLTLLGIHKERLEDYLAPQVYLFGSENWLSMEAASPVVMSNLFYHFGMVIATNGDAGQRISTAERAVLNGLERPLHISALEVTRLMDRWNRTLDYADLGIYASTNVPFGGDPDFIAADIMLQKLSAANVVALVNEAEGFPFITDGVQFALEDLQRQIGGGSGDSAKVAGQNAKGAKAGGGICAQVRLRIDQEAVITRDAFKATLELINGSATALENVSVSIVVRRGDASDATSLFGITAPTLANLSDVTGTGVVIPGTTGSAAWTIIPTDDAAPSAETVTYFVSGSLRYRQDGLDVTVPLAPAAINVLPNPNLRLKYFHERDVLADDPFTTNVVEPSQPYSLAVMVQNTGYGTARNMRISSSQPQIIENEKGLLIDFDIIATEVAGQNILPTLTVNFGDIAPGGIAIGRWLLKSTLQGQFVEYSATFEHLDGLGDPRLSLIESVDIHELIRVVRATNVLNDALPDFLVNDFPDEHFLPDTLYFSDASTAPATPVTSFLTAQTPSTSNLNAQLQAVLPPGWSYLRIPDPANGRFKLARIVRSDGVELPVENFWVTDRTFIAGGQRPLYETNLHLLDFNSTGNYTLMYSVPPAPDTTAPSSAIAALPGASYANIPLTWTGADNAGGGGLATFDVYVSDNGGPFTLWLANTTLRGGIYGGTGGHTYSFYTRARDVAGNLELAPATADATTTVSLANSAPMLTVGGDQTVNEGEVVTIFNSATDVDPDALAFSLGGGSPSGATINSSGSVTWITGEGNGPSTNVITIVVTDNGVPPLSATGSVTVVVSEVNVPPSITTITNRTINENELMTVQVFATDADVPANTVSFSFANSAPGMVIDSTSGVLSWTPNTTQGPSTNRVAVVATDNGAPPLSFTQSFNVIVRNTEGDFALSIGSTNVLAGSNSAVGIILRSSQDITNVTVTLDAPQSRLTGLVLSPMAPALASSVLLPNGTNRSELRFTTAPGQVLDADQSLASLGFATVGTNSAIVPLDLSSLAAWRSTGLALTNGRAFSGRVIIIGDKPVLTLETADVLTLYGRPFHFYSILDAPTASGFGGPEMRESASIGLGSNTFYRVNVGLTNVPGLFFQAKELLGP